MADYDHGPLRTYEIIWQSGHIETVQGHQVLFDSAGIASLFPERAAQRPMFRIHGMFPGGHWRMVLCAPEADMLSVRDVTDWEMANGDAAAGADRCLECYHRPGCGCPHHCYYLEDTRG